MIKNRQKTDRGMALIMVVVMVIIFSSLILAVVISSSTAIRRAHYYKDKNIALQIAEAGLQDAFYWMNYKGYENHGYPASGAYYFRGSDYAGSDTWIDTEQRYNPLQIPQAECSVRVTAAGTANADTIRATGYYKGRSASVSAVIRGTNTSAVNLKAASQGVAEAFNKKAVYAKTVNLSGTSVSGNITTESAKPSPFTLPEATWVEANLPISDLVEFDTENCSLPVQPAFVYRYDASGILYDNSSGDTFIVNDDPSNGVWWNGVDTYHFGKSDATTPETFISAAAVEVEADVSVPNDGGPVVISHYFKASGDISVQKDIATANNNTFAFEVDEGRVFSIGAGRTISGSLIVKNAPLQLNNITISGSLAANKDITISGTTDIDATSSPYGAAVIIYAGAGDTAVLTISGTPAATLGENQKTAVLVSSDTGTVNVNCNLFPVYDNPGQFCIVNWSNNAEVNIGHASNAGVAGGIYSYRNITLDANTQTITGLLVAGGSANLNAGALIYSPEAYQDTDNAEIYGGFTGGRRRFLPLPGSWEIIW